MDSCRKSCILFSIAVVFFAAVVMLTETKVALAADVVVVANKNVTQSSLSKDNLKTIFLGQTTSWQNGAKVEFVILKEGSDVHDEFLKKFIGRSAAQFNNFWKQQVFTGKGRFPKQFESEAKLIEYVSATAGAIGYVSAGAAKGSSTKIITINE